LKRYCTQRSSFALPSAEVKTMLFMFLFILVPHNMQV
jgi:hypothetical protein